MAGEQGALVWVPLGHSPDADLIAEAEGNLLRIQVKTSTHRLSTLTGAERWSVTVGTKGGNQSWSGTTKIFNPANVDFLFVLVGDGRRRFIPASVIEGSRSVTLGGTKYSEFEIERGQPIEHLVYSNAVPELDQFEGECLSGQKDSTVNRAAMPTEVRILSPPSRRPGGLLGDITKSERKLARSGHALLRQKRQITIPKRPCEEAGLRIGDRVRVRAEGPGRVVFERAEAEELFSSE